MLCSVYPATIKPSLQPPLCFSLNQLEIKVTGQQGVQKGKKKEQQGKKSTEHKTISQNMFSTYCNEGETKLSKQVFKM